MTQKLPSGWQLFRGSLTDFRSHIWRYLLIVGIVSLPSQLIGLSTGLSADAAITSYVTFASLFMTVALIWAIVRYQGEPMKLRQAYYDSSGALLRFLLVAAVLGLLLIPAVLGASLYALGQSPSGSTTLVEQLILGALGLLLASPSFYWLLRFGLSLYRVIGTNDWPRASLGYARRLTTGRFWAIAGRAALLLIWTLLLLVAPTIVCVGLAMLTNLDIFLNLLQLLASLIVLPFVHLYGFRLFRALEAV